MEVSVTAEGGTYLSLSTANYDLYRRGAHTFLSQHKVQYSVLFVQLSFVSKELGKAAVSLDLNIDTDKGGIAMQMLQICERSLDNCMSYTEKICRR